MTVAWLVLCGVVLYRVDRYVDRLIRLKEHPPGMPSAASVTTSTPDSARGPVVVPDDLMALAALESEEWAQRDLVDLIREKYGLLKDWQLVRTAMGVGTLP